MRNFALKTKEGRIIVYFIKVLVISYLRDDYRTLASGQLLYFFVG